MRRADVGREVGAALDHFGFGDNGLTGLRVNGRAEGLNPGAIVDEHLAAGDTLGEQDHAIDALGVHTRGD